MVQRGRQTTYLYGQPVHKRISQIGSAISTGMRMYRHLRTRTQTRKRQNSGFLTQQHDQLPLYRRRRMPWKKRRRWVGFVRKYRAASLRQLGTQIVRRSHAGTLSSGTNAQQLFAMAINGKRGATNRGWDDWFDIFAGLSLTTNDKILVTTQKLDLTLTADADGDEIEVDVYNFYFKKSCAHTDLPNLMVDCLADTATLGAAMVTTDIGVTPFDCPDLGAFVRITKVKRIYLQPGQSTSMVHRITRNEYISGQFLDEQSSRIARGTQGVLVIFKGTPSATNAIADAATLRYSAQNTYRYVVDQGNPTAAGTV